MKYENTNFTVGGVVMIIQQKLSYRTRSGQGGAADQEDHTTPMYTHFTIELHGAGPPS